MKHLINPGGRIVAIDDEALYNRCLRKGFQIPTKEQVEDFQSKRYKFVNDTKKPKGSDSQIYLATVSEGGKDGYGVASEKILEHLEDMGVSISRHNRKQKIGFLFHAPYAVMRMENPIRIIYTMFESDQIPDDWPEYLNSADLVLVPSHWCMEVFAKKGVNAKVVPLGYDDKVFKYKERHVRAAQHEPFTFLHYNAYNLRKGFLELIKAFVKEFDPSEPVKLLLKTTADPLPLPLPPSQYPNIEIVQGKVSDIELNSLCHRSDCFVFPSRGEGFGVPPLEAMATGIPAIVPNAHGITEYFDERYMYGVAIEKECDAVYARYKGRDDVGKMVVTSIDDLAKQMRYVYTHQKEAVKKGKDAAQYVKQWTFERTAQQLKQIFEDYAKRDPRPNQKTNILTLEEVK